MSTPRTNSTDVGRFDVVSTDGTPIAVWTEGHGPAVVMVHGSIADHTTFEPLVLELRDHVTTIAMDRRGFGASGDGAVYSIGRDFDDVAAVVDAVATRIDGPVALWGHSYGANCAMGGAVRSAHVDHLILYEPSLGLSYPPGSINAIEDAVAHGDHEAAISAVLADTLGMTDEDIEPYRTSPQWPARLAAAPTIPRECRVEESWRYSPGQFDEIAAPTLLLTGSLARATSSMPLPVAAATIPDARIHILEGHGHLAHHTDPALVATLIQSFVADAAC